MKDTVERIMRMEAHFDALRAALAADQPPDDALLHRLWELEAYYTGGQWLRDYEADERGDMPQGLRRGVLSQDGVYLVLCNAREKGWLK